MSELIQKRKDELNEKIKDEFDYDDYVPYWIYGNSEIKSEQELVYCFEQIIQSYRKDYTWILNDAFNSNNSLFTSYSNEQKQKFIRCLIKADQKNADKIINFVKKKDSSLIDDSFVKDEKITLKKIELAKLLSNNLFEQFINGNEQTNRDEIIKLYGELYPNNEINNINEITIENLKDLSKILVENTVNENFKDVDFLQTVALLSNEESNIGDLSENQDFLNKIKSVNYIEIEETINLKENLFNALNLEDTEFNKSTSPNYKIFCISQPNKDDVLLIVDISKSKEEIEKDIKNNVILLNPKDTSVVCAEILNKHQNVDKKILENENIKQNANETYEDDLKKRAEENKITEEQGYVIVGITQERELIRVNANLEDKDYKEILNDIEKNGVNYINKYERFGIKLTTEKMPEITYKKFENLNISFINIEYNAGKTSATLYFEIDKNNKFAIECPNIDIIDNDFLKELEKNILENGLDKKQLREKFGCEVLVYSEYFKEYGNYNTTNINRKLLAERIKQKINNKQNIALSEQDMILCDFIDINNYKINVSKIDNFVQEINISEEQKKDLINDIEEQCTEHLENRFNEKFGNTSIDEIIEKYRYRQIAKNLISVKIKELFEQKDFEKIFNLFYYKNINIDLNNVNTEYLYNYLLYYCNKDRIPQIIKYIEKNLELSKFQEFINYTFNTALKNKQLNLIEQLMKVENIDLPITQKTQNKDKLLSIAIKIDNVNVFKNIVNLYNKEELKTLINTPDERGLTPFMYACQYGNKEIIKTLINLGADLSLKDNRGFTTLDNFKLYNYYSKDYEKIRLLFGNEEIDKYNPELQQKLYYKIGDKSDKPTFKLRQLCFDINYAKNLIQEYIYNKETRQSKEEKSLLERTVFCKEEEIEETIKKLQEEIGDSDEVRYIRVDTVGHNYAIAVTKDTVLGMDSCLGYFDGVKLDNGTQVFAIGDSMQTDGVSCGIFSLETVLILDKYLKERGITLKQFVEETKDKGKFRQNNEPEEKSTEFCESIPIPKIFAHMVQRSYGTIEKMFGKENLEENKVEVITKVGEKKEEKTQSKILKEKGMLLDNEQVANNYINTVGEISAHNIVNETQEISREKFNQKIEEYKNKKARLNKAERKFKLFQGYSEEHDILIEADKDGNTKIYITELTEEERKERKKKNPYIQKVKLTEEEKEKYTENFLFKDIKDNKITTKELEEKLNTLNNNTQLYDIVIKKLKQIDLKINRNKENKHTIEFPQTPQEAINPELQSGTKKSETDLLQISKESITISLNGKTVEIVKG